MAFFSIIVPAYNIEGYLPECLDSILGQSFADWECIVVDDGSTDTTGVIADKYAARDLRFNVIHQQNQGVSAARNHALNVAKGEWLSFVDGDDFIHPDYLHISSLAIKEHPDTDLITFAHIQQKSPQFGKQASDFSIQDIDIRKNIPEQVWQRGLWNAIYRAEAFRTLRFVASPLGEDLLFYRLCLLQTQHVMFLDCALYAYRIREGSAVNTPLSYTKIQGSMQCGAKCLQELWSCGKTLTSRQYSLLLRSLFESPAFRCMSLTPKDKCKAIFIEWLSITNALNAQGHFPLWCSLRFNIVSISHSYRLWLLLFGWSLYIRVCLCAFRDSWKSFFRRLYRGDN